MSAEPDFLDVKLMGREYRVACTPEERAALLAAVDLLDGKMQEIAQRTRNSLPERVAVMAALNIAHDHLSASTRESAHSSLATSDAKRRIIDMEARLDAVLGS